MLNVLVPMAGAGKRFVAAGYKVPKPLIKVDGTPMFIRSIESFGVPGNYIYLIQKDHGQESDLLKVFNDYHSGGNFKVIEVDGLTEGAAATTLLAKDYIDNENELFICNSDQIIEWDYLKFLTNLKENLEADGFILTFYGSGPKWSYAKTDLNNLVLEVAEKIQISNEATVGIYYWRRGSDYVRYAMQMIEKNKKTNNEFYVCPVYNEAIEDGKKIFTYKVNKMIGLGTPEDLDLYKNETNFSQG